MVHAFGINPVDAKFIIGDKFPESFMNWAAQKVSGHTPGFDFSGTVVATPPNSGFNIGDEVFGIADDPSKMPSRWLMGSFAEVVAPPLDQIWLKPSTLTHCQAAALPLVGVTCVQAMEEHALLSGERLLIIGASGGVGHVATQIAAMMGVDVTGFCSSKNIEFVKQCGASTVIDYSAEGSSVFNTLLAEATKNGPFDLILDCVSSADSRDKATSYRQAILSMKSILKLERKHSCVVLGGDTGDWGKALVLHYTRFNLFPKDLELFWIKMKGCQKALKTIKELVDGRKGGGGGGGRSLIPRIEERRFTIEDIRKSFDEMRGRHVVGKIVINVVVGPQSR
jgi:NADPH:quinone reductase-like Zn-dependent oxidoreductase